ncbi:MAG: hypothetical protein J6U12_01235 [Candidatus Methanomethylophilaceae archaeon]|nr:hypothetical protein [Candidatus Methanomethylophilaceae archaeon]
MPGYSVRLPKDLVDRIDAQIDTKLYFSTRPEFVLFAMKSTAMIMAEKYRKMLEMVNDNEIMRYIKGQEKLLTARVGDAILEKYKKNYCGDPVQIMIRIPEGLNKIIDEFIIRIGYVTNKLDYIRMSILCTLESLNEMERIMQNAEAYTNEVKKTQDDLIRVVAENLIKGNDPGDILKMTVNARMSDHSDD